MEPRVLLGPATFVLILLAETPGSVAQELTCAFKVTRESAQPVVQGARGSGEPAAAKAAPKRTKETRQTLIGLAKDSLSVTHQGETSIAYHFPSKRMYVLDFREKSYADLSLYGTVAFRVKELVRRRAMREGFAAARVSPDAVPRDITDQFAVESLFSLRLPGDAGRPDAPVAKVVRQGKEWEFSRGDRRFVRFLPSDHPVPPRYRRTWTRFLVHQCSIHPTIREQIVQTEAIPEFLEFSYFDGVGSCTMTYRLESVSEGPERWAGVPNGFTPKVVAGDRLGRILARLDPKGERDTLHVRPAAERFVEEALSRGNTLDAYLGWIEYAALAGDDAECRASKAALLKRILAANDGRVLSLRFQQGGAKESEAILQAIDRIDRSGLKKGYQLDAYRGFLLFGLGRIDKANDCFLKALEANPYLLNCYRQLGDSHLQALATVEAWRCFDAIRRVDPHYYMLKDVNELEARFEKDFPEDF